MSKVKSILTVDDFPLDQQTVMSLFKRSMYATQWSITTMCASTLDEAKLLLKEHQFDIITLDGLMGLERGYDLIPFIAEFQSQKPTIIMISDNAKSIAIGLRRARECSFVVHSIVKHLIKPELRLNENFELVII
jgi:CheY-like chemotaxis protein